MKSCEFSFHDVPCTLRNPTDVEKAMMREQGLAAAQGNVDPPGRIRYRMKTLFFHEIGETEPRLLITDGMAHTDAVDIHHRIVGDWIDEFLRTCEEHIFPTIACPFQLPIEVVLHANVRNARYEKNRVYLGGRIMCMLRGSTQIFACSKGALFHELGHMFLEACIPTLTCGENIWEDAFHEGIADAISMLCFYSYENNIFRTTIRHIIWIPVSLRSRISAYVLRLRPPLLFSVRTPAPDQVAALKRMINVAAHIKRTGESFDFEKLFAALAFGVRDLEELRIIHECQRGLNVNEQGGCVIL